MSSPELRHHENEDNISARASIFDHDYPIPVAMAITALTYTATLALPFRFVWTVDNLIPFIQAHGAHLDPSHLSPFSVALSILLIPTLFFFILEFTIMRDYPPVSKATKIMFIAGVALSSIVVGLISPFLPA